MPDRQTAPAPRTRSALIAHIAQVENKERLSPDDYRLLNALRTELGALPDEPRPSYADLLATPWPFRRWLTRQRPERRFSIANACACPMAEFLSEESGRRTEVLVGTYKAPDEGPPYQPHSFGLLPAWGRRFVAAVDDTRAPDLSPAECIAILRKAEAAA